MTDPLSTPQARLALANRIKADIQAVIERDGNTGHRNHLGASLIGHKCNRYLWSVFRWLKVEHFNAKTLQLFGRGHLEEARFEKMLRDIGATVHAFQDDVDGTKGERQFRIGAVNGHFGGSLDGQVFLPDNYQMPFGFLSEYKTKSTKYFAALVKNGVQKEEPKHYAQMCVYGARYGFQYGIYMSVDKNTDDLHIEVVWLDWQHATEMENKAEAIINSRMPPERMSDNPTWRECKWCNFHGICHEGASVEKNCRSCVFAVPVENAEWRCEKFNQNIPKDFIPQGCDEFTPIV